MERAATLRLTLVRSAGDEAAFSPNYQRELKQFYHLVRADHTRISAIAFTMPGLSDDTGFTGEFVVPLSQEIGPVLARAALAWRNAQAGRVVRLTLGTLDFDVGTASALEALVTRAQALLVSQETTVPPK
ncbi:MULTISPECIES: hypothetical protein [Caballeronia]|jgi:hypothetical protein|uniref:hypothetical protein n=1 Tax=Caballeronia TaxID=1827195 RepID=UPI001FD278BD|nr:MULTISPECIES: hypothetical protein [Caballeronia]